MSGAASPSPADPPRRRPPEIAYSPAIFVSKPLAWGCLVGTFVCCPIRDWLLERFWPGS